MRFLSCVSVNKTEYCDKNIRHAILRVLSNTNKECPFLSRLIIGNELAYTKNNMLSAIKYVLNTSFKN